MTRETAPNLSPSQLRVANAVSSLGSQDRVVVVGRAGSGKGHAVAVGLASRMATLGDGPLRILVVAGARVLADQWAWTFHEMGFEALVVDPSAYRDLQLHTPTGNNPWNTPRAPLIATYIDFVKPDDRLKQQLGADWDFVVLDDIPASEPGSQSSRALTAIWESNSYFARILVTSDESTMIAEAGHATVVEVDVPTPDWKPIEIPVGHSKTDAEILERIYAKVSKLPGFVGESIFRIAGSSLFALEQALSRLTVRVHEGLPTSEAPDDTPADLLNHRIDITEVTEILDAIQGLERDGKWEALLPLVVEFAGPGPVVVFTDFAETAEYLTYLFESENVAAAGVTGRMTVAERAAVIERAQRDNLVVVVSKPTWTQRLAVAAIVHYDLPEHPKRLDERYGSVSRLRDDMEPYVLVDPLFEKARKSPDPAHP